MSVIWSSSFASPVFDDWDFPTVANIGTPGQNQRVAPLALDGGNVFGCNSWGNSPAPGTEAEIRKVIGPNWVPDPGWPLKHPPIPSLTDLTALTVRFSIAGWWNGHVVPQLPYAIMGAPVSVYGYSKALPNPGNTWRVQLYWTPTDWVTGAQIPPRFTLVTNTPFAGVPWTPAQPGGTLPFQYYIAESDPAKPFPFDGVQHAMQWAMTLTPTTYTARVSLDGNIILSTSATVNFSDPGGVHTGWGWMDLLRVRVFRIPTCGSVPPVDNPPNAPGLLQDGTCISYIEVDNTDSLTSFAPRPAVTMTDEFCWKRPGTTRCTCDLASNTITLDGKCFYVNNPTFAVHVQGPEASLPSWAYKTKTGTRIVLEAFNPPIVAGATYCLTIVNPCDPYAGYSPDPTRVMVTVP